MLATTFFLSSLILAAIIGDAITSATGSPVSTEAQSGLEADKVALAHQ
jgi:hypothetical protein